MISITNENLDNAAEAYALEVLGDDQYETNPVAVESITENFKAGAAHMLKIIAEDPEIIDQTDLTEYGR